MLQNSCGCESSFVLTPTAQLDCDCILSFVIGFPKEYIFLNPEKQLTQKQVAFFFECIERRRTGLPVAYIVGEKEFFGFDYFVSEDVLIPKPDTELLVEQAVGLILAKIQNTSCYEKIRILDVCTGSGCIIVSVWNILKHKGFENRISLFACDICDKALAVAKKNAEKYKCPVQFRQGDLLTPFFWEKQDNSFDFILANPPYVPREIADKLLLDGRNEPFIALNGDCGGTSDGTGLIKRLIVQALQILRQDGFLLMEAGEYNIHSVASTLDVNGFKNIEILKDLSNMPRLLVAKKE